MINKVSTLDRTVYMAEKIEMNVHASTIINLMRYNGYSFNLAVADIIDNSITGLVKSKNVNITIINHTVNDLYVTIQDDGLGMNFDELKRAMNLSDKGLTTLRPKDDLGKFGLGLKSASFSQCSNLIVLSKKNYKELAFTILDEMPLRNDLHRFPDSSFFKIPVQATGNNINLILDTGAHISYLNPEFVNVDTLNLRKTTDFNPILGNFEVSLVDHFSYAINEIQLDHEIGLAPSNLANMLRQMSVAGVFGYELFKVMDFYYLKEENTIALSLH